MHLVHLRETERVRMVQGAGPETERKIMSIIAESGLIDFQRLASFWKL